MINNIVSNYRNQIDELFREWKESVGRVEYKVKDRTESLAIDHKNNVFISDGVVCPEQWFSQSIRPLFLLKEAYGGESDWDLIEEHLLQNYQTSKMWNRISMWTKGLLKTTIDRIAPFEENEPLAKHYGNEYLKQIAVINVKKSGGGKASDMDVIRAYAKFDKARLKRQLELCNPTIIVCGYTASTLDIMMDYTIRKNHNPNLSYHIILNGHDVLILDYWHPANQYPDIMNYYGLMAIYQQALLAGLGESNYG